MPLAESKASVLEALLDERRESTSLRYWDSSAVVPLLVREDSSARVEALLSEDGVVVSWWGTPVECSSAIGRRERDGSITMSEAAVASRKLAMLESRWLEIAPSDELRDVACRVVRVHDLRAADALQLAAAAARLRRSRTTPSFAFVTLDERLALADRPRRLSRVRPHRKQLPEGPRTRSRSGYAGRRLSRARRSIGIPDVMRQGSRGTPREAWQRESRCGGLRYAFSTAVFTACGWGCALCACGRGSASARRSRSRARR